MPNLINDLLDRWRDTADEEALRTAVFFRLVQVDEVEMPKAASDRLAHQVAALVALAGGGCRDTMAKAELHHSLDRKKATLVLRRLLAPPTPRGNPGFRDPFDVHVNAVIMLVCSRAKGRGALTKCFKELASEILPTLAGRFGVTKKADSAAWDEDNISRRYWHMASGRSHSRRTRRKDDPTRASSPSAGAKSLDDDSSQ